MKIVIGCANFGKEYNGLKVPDAEIEKIWKYCRKHDIDTVDTARAYEYDPPGDFEIITKVTYQQPEISYRVNTVLAHHVKDLKIPGFWNYIVSLKDEGYCDKIGVSIYDDDISFLLTAYKGIDVIQLPYKQNKSKIKKYGDRVEFHARKVFADDCFIEAVKDKNVSKVVIGIDNLKQLKQNLKRMNNELE